MARTGIPKAVRKAVEERSGKCCESVDKMGNRCCRWDYMGSVHHRLSRAQGGKDTEVNLIWLCLKCHAKAHGIRVV